MGEKVKRLRHAETADGVAGAGGAAGAIVEERARRVLPVLAQVLGVSYDDADN